MHAGRSLAALKKLERKSKDQGKKAFLKAQIIKNQNTHTLQLLVQIAVPTKFVLK